MKIEYAPWIEEKMASLRSYLASVELDVVDQAYMSGLATTITQEFRTFGQVSKDETAKLDDSKYLRELITAYSFDFLRSLRLSERLGVNPNIALDIAQLSYRFNPTRYIELIRNYLDLQRSVITTAALSYPKNPEAFLDRVKEAIAHLIPLYPDLPPNTITVAAVGYPSNPEAFLEKVRRGEKPPLQEEIGAIEEVESLLAEVPIDPALDTETITIFDSQQGSNSGSGVTT